jgi:hypothetical protein
MIAVSEIWAQAKQILGVNKDDVVYRSLTDAVQLLANKGDFDPLFGYVDIETTSRIVALPREVDSVIGVTIADNPAVPRDQIYIFHLNGPGAADAAFGWEWMDMGHWPVYRQPEYPSKLIGFCGAPEDENCEMWVEGYDAEGNEVRTKVGDTWVNGWKVPVFMSQNASADDAPLFGRITRVRKPVTAGPIRLSTLTNDDQTDMLLGIYGYNETEPTFRCIRLNADAAYITIAFRKKVFKLTSQTDLIPLNNSQSILMMLRAMKAYDEDNHALGEAREATAVRWAIEEQSARQAPTVNPIQVHGANALIEQGDYVD